MKGIINGNYDFMFVARENIEDGSVHIDVDELITFDDGDEVEILKIIYNAEWASDVAYVVFNPKNGESITLDSTLVELINE